MAKVNTAEAAAKVVGNFNQSMRLPRDRYTLRLKSREFGISKSSQNPMVTLEWEVASPDKVSINGQPVTVAGTVQFKMYLPTRVNGDEEKTAKAHKRFADIYAKITGQPLTEWDDENPPLPAEGSLIDAVCSSKEEVDYKDDRKTPIKNADGTDRKRLIPFLEENSIGKSNAVLNAPY